MKIKEIVHYLLLLIKIERIYNMEGEAHNDTNYPCYFQNLCLNGIYFAAYGNDFLVIYPLAETL
jgi:hypothetical protein